MQNAEIFLIVTSILIFFLLLFQSLSVRIEFNKRLFVTIEYFPLTLMLYDFQKRKIKKKKLIKQTKRLLFFLSPFLKALTLLIKRTDTKILRLNLFDIESEEPHSICLADNVEGAINSYIYALFYLLSRSSTMTHDCASSTSKDSPRFVFEFTTSFCNVIFAFLAFLFYSICKKGRKIKNVR